SVPPEMRFGNVSPTITVEPPQRSQSTQPLPPRRRQPSFAPLISPVRETEDDAKTPRAVTNEADLAKHSGWMRTRKTTRMLSHEWQGHYFDLNGSKLNMMHDSSNGRVLDTINIDQYDVHAYTTASRSKLQAAFKKTFGATSAQPSFAFTLTPEQQLNNSRSHHFAVNSGKDRVEWMRKIMLAKAMKKNEAGQPF
ncbi:hypothetical protein LTR66_015882, partial [Elasticomyces elasticus]